MMPEFDDVVSAAVYAEEQGFLNFSVSRNEQGKYIVIALEEGME